MKQLFLFSDNSTAYLIDDGNWFNSVPTHVYSCKTFGFGNWIPYQSNKNK
jgi:hypothetical protein